jgi:hypothetical protein
MLKKILKGVVLNTFNADEFNASNESSVEFWELVEKDNE